MFKYVVSVCSMMLVHGLRVSSDFDLDISVDELENSQENSTDKLLRSLSLNDVISTDYDQAGMFSDVFDQIEQGVHLSEIKKVIDHPDFDLNYISPQRAISHNQLGLEINQKQYRKTVRDSMGLLHFAIESNICKNSRIDVAEYVLSFQSHNSEAGSLGVAIGRSAFSKEKHAIKTKRRFFNEKDFLFISGYATVLRRLFEYLPPVSETPLDVNLATTGGLTVLCLIAMKPEYLPLAKKLLATREMERRQAIRTKDKAYRVGKRRPGLRQMLHLRAEGGAAGASFRP